MFNKNLTEKPKLSHRMASVQVFCHLSMIFHFTLLMDAPLFIPHSFHQLPVYVLMMMMLLLWCFMHERCGEMLAQWILHKNSFRPFCLLWVWLHIVITTSCARCCLWYKMKPVGKNINTDGEITLHKELLWVCEVIVQIIISDLLFRVIKTPSSFLCTS